MLYIYIIELTRVSVDVIIDGPPNLLILIL